jgi:hypothetical protein
VSKRRPTSWGGYQAIDIDRKARRSIGAEIWDRNYESVLLFRGIVGLVEGSLTKTYTYCWFIYACDVFDFILVLCVWVNKCLIIFWCEKFIFFCAWLLA